MRHSRDRLDGLGVGVLGVATRSAEQARQLTDGGMPFPLLLDPDDELRRRLGIEGGFGKLRLFHPAAALAYLRAARQARDFDPIWSESRQRPAVIIVDAEMSVSWSHLGRRIGDYPSVDTVLEAAAALGTG